MAESLQKTDNRLASLDILRGFDMFWITGGGALVAALITYLGWPGLEPIKTHMEHVEWEGFRAWDMIFPLFIFITGVTMPFSFEKYLALGQRRSLYIRIIKRALVLVLLGMIYNGMLKKLDFENLRFRYAVDDRDGGRPMELYVNGKKAATLQFKTLIRGIRTGRLSNAARGWVRGLIISSFARWAKAVQTLTNS